jgi:tetratricopeptide (TPR) repeat protein
MPDSEFQAAREGFRRGEIAKAVVICRRGIQSAQSRGDLAQVWELRALLSRCLCTQGHHSEALSLLESLPLKEDVGSETRARVLNQRAFVHSQIGNFAATKAAVDEALALASAAGLELLVAEIEMTRCTLFFYLGNYDAVESCARIALEIAKEQRALFLEACAAAGMGKAAMYRGCQAEAIPWFERAVNLFENEGAGFYASAMRGELGCCHLALHEDDRALELFSQALKSSEEAGALTSYHIDLADVGAVHFRRGQYSEALPYFQKAAEIARKLGDPISTSKWLQNLSLTYARLGDDVLAKTYQFEAERANQTVAKARAAASSGK